jgi:hypothetical protein
MPKHALSWMAERRAGTGEFIAHDSKLPLFEFAHEGYDRWSEPDLMDSAGFQRREIWNFPAVLAALGNSDRAIQLAAEIKSSPFLPSGAGGSFADIVRIQMSQGNFQAAQRTIATAKADLIGTEKARTNGIGRCSHFGYVRR